jgi:hypothetical protein
MPDGNGANDWRDDMGRRVQALEKARRELEDSFLVMAQLEARMSRVVREQAEALDGHNSRLKLIETRLAEVTDKINFIIEREMRREGGPETHR